MVARGTEHRGRGDPPVGEVTFLFTDVEGSTRLWEDRPAEMDTALAVHDERLRQSVEDRGGYVFTTAGDSFAVAFDSPRAAAEAALAAQIALEEPCAGLMLRIRIGLHTGVANLRDGDYFGSTVNRCARLMSAAHGGQTVISATTRASLGEVDPASLELSDLGSHRLKDLREPLDVFQLAPPGATEEFPPLRSLGGADNLPLQLTDLVGRAHEVAEIRDLLDEGRLVTLTGAGGSGKTRLAMQVAADGLDDHAAGTWVVELANLTDPSLVADDLATTLGLRTRPDLTATETVAANIGTRRMLLVLDNCEHLADAAADLATALLRTCPELRILATSQHALNIPGEIRFRVPSLPVPTTTDPHDVAATEAGLLFAERAGAVSPGFVIDGHNAAAVASICRRLDGIPLAIELAAARVGILTPDQIADRLDHRFRLLGGPERRVAPRHQTLRAAMEWSHGLLGDAERTLFRRLGIFAGEFDLSATEAVCANGSIDDVAVLGLIADLADKSLVIAEPGPNGARYRLLQTVRDYAAAELELAGEREDLGRAHARHYADVAEQLLARRRDGDLSGAIAGYRADEDNLRGALGHALTSGDALTAARIVAAVGYLWYLVGAFQEGISWCQALHRDGSPEVPDAVRARVLHVHGTLVGSWRDPDHGRQILEEEVDILRRLDDRGALAGALNNLGNLQDDLGLDEAAAVSLREAAEIYAELGRSAALPLASLAYGPFRDGRLEEARERYEAALREATRHDDEYAVALARIHLAHCAALVGGPLATARADALDARRRFLELGVAPAVRWCDVVLGHIARLADDPVTAAGHLLDALAEPEGHWYTSTKFWALQIASAIVDDADLTDRVRLTVSDHYRTSRELQPAWVFDDLRTGGEPDRSASPAADGTAPALDVEDAIEAIRSALGRLVAA